MKNKIIRIRTNIISKITGKGHAIVGLFIVVFLVFLFGISSMIYVDSYTKTLEEQRKATYGAWHIGIYDTTEEVYEDICNHGIVESTGTMEVYGYAVEESSDEGINILGSVGYADDTLIQMGNITLLDGHFPSSESEIAMEAATLDRMGYSYELGQKININYATEIANEDSVPEVVTFTLCGVVKNYSAYWKSDGYWLTSCFVSNQFAKDNRESMLYTFAELESQYVENADDLSILVDKDGYFVKNEFTYLQYSEEQTGNFDLRIQQTVIILASCLFMLIFINMELKQRYHSFVMMRTIGATKGQIIGFFIRGKVRILCIGSILGIVCGIIFPYLIFGQMGNLIGGAATYYINIAHILVMIFVLYLSAMTSLAFSMVRLFQIPLRGMAKQQNVVKKYNRRKRLRTNHLFAAFHRADFKQKIVGITLTCVASFLIYVLAYQTWDAYTLYAQHCENYPADYVFGLLASKAPPRDTMSEEELEEIKHAYGVAEVETIALSDYYGISFEGDYNKEYAEEVQDDLSEYLLASGLEAPNGDISGTLIGVSDNLMSLYINEIDSEGIIDELKDGEVILYLPSYTKDKDDNLLIDITAWQATEGATTLLDDEIKSGDVVQIETEVKTEELNIVGIIRSFDDTPLSYNPMRSYSLFCNENTYRELVSNYEYAYVLVYNETTTIPYQTDVELSKIQTGLYFNNNRVQSSEQLQNVILQMILALLLCTFAILIMTVIRFGIRVMDDKRKAERYQLLYKLGMSKQMMLKHIFGVSIFEGIVGCGIALIVFLLVRFFQTGKELLLFPDYVKLETIEFLKAIWSRFCYQTDGRFLIIVVLSIYVFNLLIMAIHDYRYIYVERKY